MKYGYTLYDTQHTYDLSVYNAFNLFLLLFLSLNLASQTSSIKISGGTGFTNDHFIFNQEQKFLRWEWWIVNHPSTNINTRYSFYINDWISFSAGIGYSRYSARYENSGFIDKLGFFNDYKPEQSVRNYISPNLGLTYTSNQRKKWSFFGSAQFTVALPINCYDQVTVPSGRESKLRRYTGDRFSEGIMYGPGLEAGVLLRPWRYGSQKNLSFSLFANGQLLFYHGSDFNPKYIFGPELGVVYNF